MTLDADLEKRLSLLETSGQVDADIAGFLRGSLSQLAGELNLKVTDEAFGSLSTHTAMAFQRVRDGEAVETWEVDHADELEQHPRELELATRFARDAHSTLSLDVPPQEVEFIALHLASLSLRGT
jgi:transcriptional regulatory protein LevR